MCRILDRYGYDFDTVRINYYLLINESDEAASRYILIYVAKSDIRGYVS